MPRHNRIIMPARATKKRKRVFVRKCRMTLAEGSWAFVDFHVMLPFGNMLLTREGRGREGRPKAVVQPSASNPPGEMARRSAATVSEEAP
jgi:hypothetical protein